MTVPLPVATAPQAPLAALLGSDRVDVRLSPALAALGRLDRLGRPYGPVVRHGGLAAFLLAPGTAELVPELLGWLGWGAELGIELRPRRAAAGVPRRRGAEKTPPRPERQPGSRPAAWLRPRECGPVLDLRSPDLLRLLDCLAQEAFAFSYASRTVLGTRPRSLT